MLTPNERLEKWRTQRAEKLQKLEGYNNTIEKTRKSIKTVNGELAKLNEKIAALEARILTETLRKKGINVSEITKAVESGAFDNKDSDNKDSDNKESSEVTNGATYSTSEKNADIIGIEKEDIDDIGDS